MNRRAQSERARREKMICPACGREMNHHASKLVDPTGSEEAARANPMLGGIVEEIYTCPDCGRAESREEGCEMRRAASRR